MADINVDLGNVRGLKGDPGDPGQDGQDGARGSLWYTGTALTHTQGSAATETGIDGALAGDMYLNTESSNVYQCTTGGDSGEAVWTFLQNIRGANGNGSLVASTAPDGYTDVTFADALGEEPTFRAGNTRQTLTGALGIPQNSIASGGTVLANVCEARGDVACVDLYITGLSIAPAIYGGYDNPIATLPEGFRPKRIQRPMALYFISGRGTVPAVIDIETDGRIETRACTVSTGTMTGLLINVSFMRA